MVVTHAFFNPPGMDINDLKKAVELGGFIEFCAGAVTAPIPDYGALGHNLDDFVEAIQTVGPEHVIISTDAGQDRKPWFTECIRVFAQCLHQKGISLKALRLMMVENQRYLLNIKDNFAFGGAFIEETNKEG